MDLGLREWLFIIGPIFVVAVLVHGYWRMRRSSNTVTVSLGKQFQSRRGEPSDDDDLALLKAELPSGGARIVNANAQKPEQNNLNLEEEVPVLMEPVGLKGNGLEQDTEAGQENGKGEQPSAASCDQSSAEPVVMESKIAESTAQTVVVVYVSSNRKGFNGQQLLENLSTAGLEFGEMNIFHLCEAGSDKILFSLANGIEPGSFDLDSMATLTTPAVSLFIELQNLDDPIAAYDLMLNTARQLATEMDGVLQDESRSALTNRTIEHWRQTIREHSLKNH